ncbi:hypothetical protein [Glycomyces sp. NPDC047010]|uniref:hypothetical protein n=1 Tax=Glycomyces sp. NPDC047010 TaxID=3155023 RepID=UPI0033DFA1D4
MRKLLRRLCYGFEGPDLERSAGVYLARALLFAFVGLWQLAVAVLLIISVFAGWWNREWLSNLTGIGVLGFSVIAMIGFVQPAHHRYTLLQRRSNREDA